MTRLASVAVVSTVAAVTGLSSCSRTAHVEPDQQRVEAPLQRLEVSRHADGTAEVFAELEPDVRLSDVVEMAVFGGFSADMTPERALAEHGQPPGRWVDPLWGTDSPYYETPLARVSIAKFHGSDGTPGWKLVAYPKAATLEAVVHSESLRRQLIHVLPGDAEADVTVARRIGLGRIQLVMTRSRCRAVVRLEQGA